MFKKILVLVDDQPASLQAIRQGVELARVNNGEILFFHLLPNFDLLPVAMHDGIAPRPKDYEQATRSEASALLHRASAMAEAAGVYSARSMGSSGAQTQAMCVAEVADKRRCELIVVGSSSRNALVRLIGGSIIPGLISCAWVPVLVCQTRDASGKTKRRKKVRPNNICSNAKSDRITPSYDS